MCFSTRSLPWLLLGCAAFCVAVTITIKLTTYQQTPMVEGDTGPRGTIGEKVPNIVLPDGRTLQGLVGKKALVAFFLSFECPVSISYSATLTELVNTYGPRGVGFVGITMSEEGGTAEVARQALAFDLRFPIFPDQGRAAVRAFQAKVTPEVFLLDEQLVLRYRGRIDDQYAARLKRKNKVSSDDLRRALDEVLAGKPVTRPVTQAIGCPIPLEEGGLIQTKNPRRPTSVTFYRDVLPILQERCQTCHRPGDVGPFSLMSYRQAVNWASDIKEYTQSRRMPPWKPVAGASFQSKRKLTDGEIQTLASWVDNGTPQGDVKDAPPPKEFPDGWQLGRPDLILTVPGEFQLGPSGPDLYRYFVLPTKLPKDRDIAAVEVRPGNRRVVHHAILFVDRKGRGRRLARRQDPGSPDRPARDTADRGPGYSLGQGFAFLPGFLPDGVMGGWSPGHVVRRFPKGVGYSLPRGADLILQLHYHRSGRTEKDRTQVGLYFSREAAGRHIKGVALPAQFLFIPAGAKNFRVEGSVTVRQDCRLYLAMPHMHKLGRQIKLSMTPPGGSAQTLVAIDDWDYNWQETFFPREPIPIKAGTRLTVSGVFDNSARNPNNSNQPPRVVWHGVQTSDEMCAAFLGIAADKPGPVRFDIHMKIPFMKSQTWNLPGWGF
jgi:hypothetical protein